MDLLTVDYGMRNVGPNWKQFPVESREEIISVINRHLGFKHIGISVCEFHEGVV